MILDVKFINNVGRLFFLFLVWWKRPPQRHDLCLNVDFFIDKNLNFIVSKKRYKKINKKKYKK